ncbi:MAG: Peptidyl-prolyl isomerase cwc27 [Caeruleum heppii]|nr:MAG: Peptidyl-prolyl isomerase cwc27 [Caeruleum heppii]
MSSLYNLEPAPTAKVLLQTTGGDILLELFGKQTPLTTRNFLQLCLNGYYDNTIFHRLVPGFVLQGGDPTGTGQGGEAIYEGGLFADEFHSRLKFNRRGLLGMANGGKKDDNGSQFFLTLGKTEELQGRNTMFGRVVGDTIYNLMKMGEADLDEGEGSERPMYPARITSTEVIVNPFEDMVRQEPKVKAVAGNKELKKTKKPKKGGKTLLSFGGEEGGDDDNAPVVKKAKFNTKLVTSANGHDHAPTKEDTKAARSVKPTVEKSLRKRRSPSPAMTPNITSVASKTAPPAPSPSHIRKSPTPSRSPSASPVPIDRSAALLSRTNAQIADLKASMKRTMPVAAPITTKKKSALEAMIPETSTRGRKRKLGGAGADDQRDREALGVLRAFQEKLGRAAQVKGERRGGRKLQEEEEMKDPDEDDGTRSPHKSPQNRTEPEAEKVIATTTIDPAEDDDDDEATCDLHFIHHCESCRAWDNTTSTSKPLISSTDHQPISDVDVDDPNDTSWMSHALSFAKDRLGKDLTWKRKTEEELVVIDPREQEKEILGGRGRGGKTGGRGGGSSGGGGGMWERGGMRGRG